MEDKERLDNLQDGILLAIEEKRKFVNDLLPALTMNELKRTVQNLASFPRMDKKPVGKNELEILQAMYAIKDLQVEKSILSIAERQEELDNEGDNDE